MPVSAPEPKRAYCILEIEGSGDIPTQFVDFSGTSVNLSNTVHKINTRTIVASRKLSVHLDCLMRLLIRNAPLLEHHQSDIKIDIQCFIEPEGTNVEFAVYNRVRKIMLKYMLDLNISIIFDFSD